MDEIKSKIYRIIIYKDDHDEPFALWIRDKKTEHAIRINLKKGKKEIYDYFHEWKVI
jgi:hypothetical protein